MVFPDYDLVIIGTGISIVGQMTTESLSWIQRAECFLYAANDPISEHIVRNINKGIPTESLNKLYQPGIHRMDIYIEMVEQIMKNVRAGYKTVVAFYGHPAVFAYATHKSIAMAQAEGFRAKMLPGISAQDCLFADLAIDPCDFGCNTLEATDFLLSRRPIDTSAYLLLWQIGTLAFNDYDPSGKYDKRAMPLLIEKLSRLYAPDHEVILYQASTIMGGEPVIKKSLIADLLENEVSVGCTLCIPPFTEVDVDEEMYNRCLQLFPNKAKPQKSLPDENKN